VLAHDNRWFGEVRGARAVLEEVAAEIEDGQSGDGSGTRVELGRSLRRWQLSQRTARVAEEVSSAWLSGKTPQPATWLEDEVGAEAQLFWCLRPDARRRLPLVRE
jgi:hypothetical protein